MMVDLDDDPEWSVQDEIEDEDEERFLYKNCLLFFRFYLKKLIF
jgi:hypothetical protein